MINDYRSPPRSGRMGGDDPKGRGAVVFEAHRERFLALLHEAVDR